jgi:glycerophosphoryl diester phosphodiesterase
MRYAFILLLFISSTLMNSDLHAAPPAESKRPRLGPWSGVVVIAHRGASGDRPEHTLEAYQRAIEQGADIIEPDLVMTKDSVLVARHENEISETTDVASRPEFAARKTSKLIDGKTVTGFFTEDFTLAELKTLRARERLPQLRAANTAYNDLYEVPTFAEVIALAKRYSALTNRVIGLYPELKHPSYFAQLDLPMEAALVNALHAAGYLGLSAPVFIQCFEVAPLQKLRALTDLPLVQLVDAQGAPWDFIQAGDMREYQDLLTPKGLSFVAGYANALGVHKNLIIPRTSDQVWQTPTPLVAQAHAAGLHVHPWTFRAENFFLPAPLRVGDDLSKRGQAVAEITRYLELGIDGFFTDQTDIGVSARAAHTMR